MSAPVRPGTGADLTRRVHRRLLAEVDRPDAPGPGAGPAALRDRLSELLHDEDPLLTPARHAALLAELLHEVSGLGPLEPLFADPGVTEVMINHGRRVYVERAGRLEAVPLALDPPTVLRLVERVIGPLGLRLDRASPVVDARLPDGSRLHAVIPPLAVDGPCVTIRRFTPGGVALEDFGVPEEAAAFLRWAVTHGANVVVSGGTAAGKTTLCNALASSIPLDARVVTIEETAELALPLAHVVRLEARLPNAEGAGGVAVRDLVRAALRMRPDRIVVGEVRGAEAFDLLQALNTGHDGSLTTVHANGVGSVVDRLTGLACMAGIGLPADALRRQVADAIDLVVHVARRDGRRRVEAVAEVHGTATRAGVAPIFLATGATLAAVGSPSRAPRRTDAPAPDPRWFACSA